MSKQRPECISEWVQPRRSERKFVLYVGPPRVNLTAVKWSWTWFTGSVTGALLSAMTVSSQIQTVGSHKDALQQCCVWSRSQLSHDKRAQVHYGPRFRLRRYGGAVFYLLTHHCSLRSVHFLAIEPYCRYYSINILHMAHGELLVLD